MSKSRKLLKFFNLVDRAGDLSITNIAVIVMVVKMAVAPQFTITECGALLVTLLNYGHKRYQSSKVEKETVKAPEVNLQPVLEQIQSVESQLAAVQKVAEEAGEKASKLALAAGMKQVR